MTQIVGNVLDVGSGGLHGSLTIWSGYRPSENALIAPRRRQWDVTNGQLPDTVQVLAGPVTIEIDMGLDAYTSFEATVPDQPTVTIQDLFLQGYVWEPYVITQVAADRARAEAAADRAEAAAQDVDAAIDGAADRVVQEVEQDRVLAEAARVAAEAARDHAEGSKTAAADSATDAAASAAEAAVQRQAAGDERQAADTARGEAVEARDTAVAAQQSAEESAGQADDSAAAAATSAGEAAASAAAAEVAESGAETARQAADGAATRAEAAEAAALGSAEAAEGSAGSADTSAGVATDKAAEATGAAAQADAAKVAAEGNQTAAAGSAQAAIAAQQAAEDHEHAASSAASDSASSAAESSGSAVLAGDRAQDAASSASTAEQFASQVMQALADTQAFQDVKAAIGGLSEEWQADIAAAIADLVGQAPETMDTIQEIAQALGNDPNFFTTVMEAIGQRVAKTDPRLSDARPPTAHDHPMAEIVGLVAALAEKSDKGHGHTWNQVSGKPTAFPSTIPLVSGLEDALADAGSTDASLLTGALTDQVDANWAIIDVDLSEVGGPEMQMPLMSLGPYLVMVLQNQNALEDKSDVGHTHTAAEVGLGNVDNTSDADKPVSTATQAALTPLQNRVGAAPATWRWDGTSLPTSASQVHAQARVGDFIVAPNLTTDPGWHQITGV